MISFVKGNIQYVGKDFAEVFCAGVGYKIFCSASTLGGFFENKDVELFTYLHIRENLQDLYGFSTREERDFFETLLDVSGIGPKGAVGILSAAPVGMLKTAIASGDMSVLTKVSGIGQKTAQRVVMELKGKIKDLPTQVTEGFREGGDVIEALVSLGYSRFQAQTAVTSIPSGVEGVENKVKEALKILAK